MSYYNKTETNKRIAAVQAILQKRSLDAALVYFDELNIANGWYLTGWCGQFEKGAVFVPAKGEPWLLGGLVFVIPCAPAGFIRVGCGIYAVLIAVMAGLSCMQHSRFFAFGALLFLISDSILAWNKFVSPLPAPNTTASSSELVAFWWQAL